MTGKKNGAKIFQCYDIHTKTGKILKYEEDYDIPDEECVIEIFKRGDEKFLEYGDLCCGYTIPYDQISFIVATDIRQQI